MLSTFCRLACDLRNDPIGALACTSMMEAVGFINFEGCFHNLIWGFE